MSIDTLNRLRAGQLAGITRLDLACGLSELPDEVFALADSLGGVESLVCFPMVMTHDAVPEKQRLELGITGDLLRLSIGIEGIDDLLADLKQALA